MFEVHQVKVHIFGIQKCLQLCENVGTIEVNIYNIIYILIQGVLLATEPGISLIILPLTRILQRNLKRIQTHSSSFLTQRTYSCSNFFAISSLVLELLKKCRVR